MLHLPDEALSGELSLLFIRLSRIAPKVMRHVLTEIPTPRPQHISYHFGSFICYNQNRSKGTVFLERGHSLLISAPIPPPGPLQGLTHRRMCSGDVSVGWKEGGGDGEGRKGCQTAQCLTPPCSDTGKFGPRHRG